MIAGILRLSTEKMNNSSPEDVAPDTPHRSGPRGHSDVEVLAVVRDRLQQMREMQSRDAQLVDMVREVDRQPLHKWAQARTCPSRISLNRSRPINIRSAPTTGFEVATSRPVTSVTTFSAVRDSPAASWRRSRPMANSSSTSRYVANAGAWSRHRGSRGERDRNFPTDSFPPPTARNSPTARPW